MNKEIIGILNEIDKEIIREYTNNNSNSNNDSESDMKVIMI